MITSVGHDVDTSCASIRAGITRPSEIVYFETLDGVTQETIPLIGHSIQCVGDGFDIIGLWIRFGLECFNNLTNSNSLPDMSDLNFWSSTGFIGVIPPINDARFNSDHSVSNLTVKKLFLDRMIELTGLPFLSENIHLECTGRFGLMTAVQLADKLLGATNSIKRIIILAIDSYLDPFTLEWLDQNDRLKAGDNPVGIAPGEAAACIMLELVETAMRSGINYEILINQPIIELENESFNNGLISYGTALARTIRQTLLNSNIKLPFDGDIISDMNGEYWRAHELGCARVKTLNELGSDANFIYPANSLGETGAASSSIAVCMAVTSLMRSYSKENHVLVLSSSDDGHVGGLCVYKNRH